jgi:hypothetical protein
MTSRNIFTGMAQQNLHVIMGPCLVMPIADPFCGPAAIFNLAIIVCPFDFTDEGLVEVNVDLNQ